MKDMLGNDIAIDDVVIYPGGNARYGGLKMIVGIVIKMTPKRITLLTGHLPFDGKKYKTTSKTGVKVLVCNDEAVLSSETVQEMRKQLRETDE